MTTGLSHDQLSFNAREWLLGRIPMENRSKLLIVGSNAEELMGLISYLEDHYDLADVDFPPGTEPAERVAAHYPDLILVDDMLAEPNCYELCHILKSDTATQHVPIVLMSDLSVQELEQEIELIHADDFIARPIQKNELLEKVETLMEFHRAR